MIQGWFGDQEALFFEIELVTANELELVVDVMLDTGFSGWLAINEQDLQGLDWIYLQTRVQQTAQGEANFKIYAGKVKINRQEFDIPVHVGQGVTEILLGRQWLKTRRLVVDIQSGTLTLGE
ncbi:aspartyl protease [Nostoc favosum]|uniref:Aspartyl protease n=1 Tax=Nostoc favosum CHAB5714 TaxID=2780399 RepID=A0ABS8IDI8_9NOSO|nr:aspartyl protease [Nostoc favosum]MCC5602106.1 aspartyl protease [Nostoc favosum CHAB5714]